MTTYALQWGKGHDHPQRMETVEAPEPGPLPSFWQYDGLAAAIRDKFTPRVKRPWARGPIQVTVTEAYGVREGLAKDCGYFQIIGRRTITGTWWAVEA